VLKAMVKYSLWLRISDLWAKILVLTDNLMATFFLNKELLFWNNIFSLRRERENNRKRYLKLK